MLFYKPAFLIIFLPVTLAGYFLLGKRRSELARIWLLAASLVFYSLGVSANLALLLASIGGNFLLAKSMEAGRTGPISKKLLLAVGVCLNLGVLVYYKCLGVFSLQGTDSGLGYFMDILIPLGLSFFTLQQIAFLVDTYRGRIKETNLLRYALFVSFFPQLIAGPIVRYQEMVPQLEREDTFRFQYENLAVGSFIFILGALKKLLIADNLAPMADVVFANAAHGTPVMMLDAWLGAVAVYLQLYFDFSAYSDMAIGIARTFGITLPINFDSPMKSHSLPHFFLRWHITLYRFLMDYLLFPLLAFLRKIPIGGLAVKRRLTFCVAIATIFCVSGLWHGMTLTFLTWGLMNGVAIALIYLGKDLRILPKRSKSGKAFKWLVATNLFCVFSSVVFRSQSLDQVGAMLKAMAGFNGLSLPKTFEPWLGGLKSFGVTFQGVLKHVELGWDIDKALFFIVLLAAMGIALLGPNIYDLTAKYAPALGFKGGKASVGLPGWLQLPSRGLAVAMAVVTAIMFSLVAYSGGSGSATFIYFHF